MNDVCIIVCDGLKSLPESIAATWPQTITQTSSVHHGVDGIVPLVVCAAAGRTHANKLPSRSTCRPVRPRRGRLGDLASGSSTVSAEMSFQSRAGHASGCQMTVQLRKEQP